MSESVQTLNVSEEKRLDFLRELWDMREGKNSDFAHVVYGQIGQLPEEAKREFTRGKMSELRQMLFECDSRSGAFELSKAASLCKALIDLGLAGDSASGKYFIDTRTGKRVSTRLRELARLKWDWDSDEARQWLRENWTQAVAMPLDELKHWVRCNNPDARAADDKRVGVYIKLGPAVKEAAELWAEVFGQTLSEFVNRAITLRIERLCKDDDDD